MNIKSGIIHTFITRIGIVLLSFVYAVFLARLLEVEGNGIFAIYIANISLFITVLSLGLNPALTHFIANRKLKTDFIVSSLTFFSIVATVLFASVIYLGGDWLLPNEINYLSYKILIVLSFFPMFSATFVPSILSAYEKFGAINILRISIALMYLVVYIVLYLLKLNGYEVGLREVIMAYCIMHWVQLIISLVYLRRDTILRFNFSFIDFNTVRYLWAFAGVLYVANSLQFLNYRIDFWILEYFQGSKEVGTYALAFSLMQKMWILPTSIGFVLLPLISKDIDTSKRLIVISRIALWILISFGFVLVFILRPTIVLLYGVEFIDTYYLLIIMLLGGIPFTLTSIYTSYFAGIGKVKYNMYGSLIGLVGTVVLDIALIPKYGNKGAAIASSISYFSSTVYSVVIMKRLMNVNYKDLLFVSRSDINLLVGVVRKYKFGN